VDRRLVGHRIYDDRQLRAWAMWVEGGDGRIGRRPQKVRPQLRRDRADVGPEAYQISEHPPVNLIWLEGPKRDLPIAVSGEFGGLDRALRQGDARDDERVDIGGRQAGVLNSSGARRDGPDRTHPGEVAIVRWSGGTGGPTSSQVGDVELFGRGAIDPEILVD